MRPSPGTNTVRQLRHGPVSFSVATEIDNVCPKSSILVSLMRRVTSSGIGNTLNMDIVSSLTLACAEIDRKGSGPNESIRFLRSNCSRLFFISEETCYSSALFEAFILLHEKPPNTVNLWSQIFPKRISIGDEFPSEKDLYMQAGRRWLQVLDDCR